MPETLYPFRGIITKVTDDGRCGIVELEEETEGKIRAVINNNTGGRVQLMSKNSDGQLAEGTTVSGTGRQGPDALLATNINHVEGKNGK